MTSAARSADRSVSDASLPVGIVRSAIVPVLADARISSEQVTEALHGHAVRILSSDESGDWVRVRTRDGYEGWMHRGYLAPSVTAADRMQLEDADEADEGARLSLGCSIRGADGMRRELPLGAIVTPEDEVLAGDVIALAWRAGIFQQRGTALIQTASERFEGAPYQWGGITPWGADCSGFVQTVFWLHGLLLPRDASQQATRGDDAGRNVQSLLAADLLFFSDRPDHRISHVGIATGDGHMVHLSLGRGGYAVDNLSDSADPYVKRLLGSFQFARRILHDA